MQSTRFAAGLAFIVVLYGVDRAWTQEATTPDKAGQNMQLAPVNPAFQDYVREVRAGRRPTRTASGRALGFVPSPVDLSHLAAKGEVRAARDPSLPASYDLRALGKVTPVGNQNPYGTCWTFATYGSMESCLLPGAVANFSENNLANLSGFDGGFDAGGDGFMSTAYLTRWSGPIAESDDPYHNVGGSPTNKPVQRHIQQVIILPNQDHNAIKHAIMDYGGVWTSVRYEDPYYDEANHSYYYNSTNSGNHAITVVGWDDNYDRTRFKTHAPHNGAWIIKNSWGTDWGDKGYFYCSYDDTKFGIMVFVFMNAEPVTNYTRICQHDPFGAVNCFGGGETAWGANVFINADSAPSSVRAASFYALTTNTSYQVFVYTGISPNAPRSGTLKATARGTLPVAGYYTIPLDAPAPLRANERFSVVVQLTTPGFNFPLAIEYAINGYSSQATAAAGQSFFSMDGTQWSDCAVPPVGDPTMNLCIKAFASVSTPPTSVTTPAVVTSTVPRQRTGEPAAVETAVGQQFKLVTPPGETVDFFLGFSSSPDEADLRLMYSGNQRTFATLFEGKWMTIGTKAAPKTFGKSLILDEGILAQDGVQWTFSHKLKSGQSCGIYQNRDGKWVNTHTVTCK